MRLHASGAARQDIRIARQGFYQINFLRRFQASHGLIIPGGLTGAALVSLAIIAYKQPITRVEIEEIRRVDVSGIVKGLMEKRLIKMVGRKKVPGKPIMYGTTKEFLEYFGLKELSDLPRKEEFLSLYENEMTSQEGDNKEESKEAELFDSVPDDPS